MSGRSVSDLLSEYSLVLRGMGLTEVGIARLHDAPEPDEGESIHEVLERQVSGTPTDSQLFGRLCKTLVESARGIDSPAEYWNTAPEVHLRELLVPYGLDVSFEPTRKSDSIADGTFDIHLTDADGTSYRTRFSYPDSKLDDDNYPALLYCLEQDILSAAGLTFARLRSPTGRWRFVMLTVDQLEALQNRYGERIDVLGEPLLAEHQPEDFVEEGAIPIPEWYDIEEESESTGTDLDELLQEGTDVSDVSPEVPTEEDVAAPELEGVETEEEIVQAVQPDSPGERTTGPITPDSPAGGSVEASDDQVQSVFGDLSDVSLETATDGGPSATTPADDGSLAIDGSGGAPAADPVAEDEPMDELFNEIEREVATKERDAGLEGDDDASIAELVDDEEAAGDHTRPADSDRDVTDAEVDALGPSSNGDGLDTLTDRDEGAVHDDGPTVSGDEVDTTASELFDRLDRERADRA